MRIALIPVKELSSAKTRLSPLLDDAARRALTLAMYRDALDAALACAALDGVAAVTRDDELLSIAEEAGAQPMPEPGGLNEALDSAARTLARRSDVERLLVLAADLPLARAADIAAVVEAQADVAIVASNDGGTNALALTPGAFAFRYGPNSARLHVEAAREAGLSVEPLDLPGLALDIDTPADLELLRDAVADGRRAGRRTLATLQKLNLVSPPVQEGKRR